MGLGTSAAELTLRDLVQRFAEEYSIQFLPKFGRFQDGQQVQSSKPRPLCAKVAS